MLSINVVKVIKVLERHCVHVNTNLLYKVLNHSRSLKKKKLYNITFRKKYANLISK